MRGNLQIAACTATSATRLRFVLINQFHSVTTNGDLSGLEIPNDFMFCKPVHTQNDVVYVFAGVESGRETNLFNGYSYSNLPIHGDLSVISGVQFVRLRRG